MLDSYPASVFSEWYKICISVSVWNGGDWLGVSRVLILTKYVFCKEREVVGKVSGPCTQDRSPRESHEDRTPISVWYRNIQQTMECHCCLLFAWTITEHTVWPFRMWAICWFTRSPRVYRTKLLDVQESHHKFRMASIYRVMYAADLSKVGHRSYTI